MDSCMTHRITFLAMARAAAVCNCALRFAFTRLFFSKCRRP